MTSPSSQKEFYFCLHLTENEHYVVEESKRARMRRCVLQEAQGGARPDVQGVQASRDEEAVVLYGPNHD